MDTVLVTGAAGFVGSHLCDLFISNGFKVIGFDSFVSGNLKNIEHLSCSDKFNFMNFDVTKEAKLNFRVDLILHFASLASPVYYMNFPVETLLVNSIGTLNMIRLAKDNNARFVFASTSEVYGDPLIHPQVEGYFGNVNPVGLRSVYDEGKRFAESLTMAYFRKYSLDTRILRIFNTYGPRMRPDDGRVIPNFIVKALRNEDIEVYGDGSQTRSFCYVDDLVKGIFGVAIEEGINGEIVNLGNPEEVTILDLANLIKETTNSKSRIISKEPMSDDPKRRCPDISKVRRLTGWEPKVSLREGLTRTVEYFKSKV